MKKTFFTALLALSFAAITWTSCSQDDSCVEEPGLQEPISKKSHYVSLEEARANLLDILRDFNSEADSRGSFVGTKIISEAFTVNLSETESRAADSTLIHVFNFTNNQGFAIMSTDDRLPDLIALAESGTFSDIDGSDVSGDPDRSGLHLIIPEVELFLRERIDEADPKSWAHVEYRPWKSFIYNRNKRCVVKWGQDFPYNDLCPISPNGFSTKTGCVATALAQLMSVYKYPKSYNGYNFPWDEMVEYPNVQLCSSDAVNATARLMELLGRSNNLDVEYGENSSSAYISKIPRTLENFGYTYTGTVDDYSTEDVVYDLKYGFPVIISALNKMTYKGHAWLGHGLILRTREIEHVDATGAVTSQETQNEWYIQCNWGNKGSGDGYYLSGIFDMGKKPKYDDDGKLNSDTIGGPRKKYAEMMAITGIER